MASPSLDLIKALRNTVNTLSKSSEYQWGHMGSCNCGFLAQELTKLNKVEIHSRAMQKYGDWNEQLNDYCPTSGLLMDDLITELLDKGLDTSDLKNLEKLSDSIVLQTLPISDRNLKHNHRDDVVTYLTCWADLLESKLLADIEIEKVEPASVNAL